jgi:hypothetical protein
MKDDINKKQSGYHNLGDKIERIGEKIGGRLGRKIYEFGNKLEHKSDKGVKGDRVKRTVV